MIDSTTAGIYVHEIRNQCAYVQASLEMFNQAMEKGATIGILYCAQNMLTHSAMVARTLFPVRHKAAKHAESLREMLQIDDKHPLNNKQLLKVWDFPEDRMEDWIEGSRDRFVLMDYVGPFGMVDDKKVEGMRAGDVFRQVDPETLSFVFRGDVFALQGIAHAVADINERVNQVHKQMFPETSQPVGTLDGKSPTPPKADGEGAGSPESETDSEPDSGGAA
jgi:hypothetical protein